MIRVLFFGSFTDLVDSPDGIQLDSGNIHSVADIIARIAASNPALHREITAPQVMCAVNQEIVPASAAVSEGDEVAFLPPVTGG